VIAGILWCRVRRRRGLKLPVSLPLARGDAEESIPLRGAGNGHAGNTGRSRRAPPTGWEGQETQQAVFEVGDSDDEESKSPAR
jgi:hypothetical protein